MQYSTNYNLKLMEGTDKVKRQDFVDNFTTIDTQMKNIDNKHSAYGTTSGTNSYTVNLTGVTSYYDGLKVIIKIGTTCTGACSLNINNLGAKTILDGSGNTITSGSLKAGIPYNLCYNGTNFILLGKGGGGGTATANQILNGYTATTNSGLITGTMTDRGAISSTLNCGGSYTIPAGYHNGSGKITANSLASQTSSTATVDNILSGKTAYVNGNKLTGNMTNRSNTTTQWCGYETCVCQPNPVDPSQALITFPNYGGSGYYDDKSSVCGNLGNLNAANIKAGVKIGRSSNYGADNTNTITGTFTADATATAAQILNGQSAYVNGNKITGTMPKITQQQNPSQNSYIYTHSDGVTYLVNWIKGGYLEPWQDFNGQKLAEAWVPQDKVANAIGLTANKILKGNTICGITGTATGSSIVSRVRIENISHTQAASSFLIDSKLSKVLGCYAEMTYSGTKYYGIYSIASDVSNDEFSGYIYKLSTSGTKTFLVSGSNKARIRPQWLFGDNIVEVDFYINSNGSCPIVVNKLFCWGYE